MSPTDLEISRRGKATDTPAVSVLIPTYNRAAFLRDTLASVFGQTLPPHEVILVDDGSTDDTINVVQSFAAEFPRWAERLRYVKQDNQGKSAALNTAIPLVTGDWIAFNDSDDTWMPDKLERQFAALHRFPDCLASFTETTLNEFNDRHPQLIAEAKDFCGKVETPVDLYPLDWPGTYMQTLVVRADVMKACGEIDPELRLAHDVDLLFRLGLITPFCYVNLPLVTINREPQRTLGIMTSYPARSLRAMIEREAFLMKWLALIGDSRPTLRRTLKHELASARSALANRYILAGDVAATRQMLRAGMRDCPEPRLFLKWLLAAASPAMLKKMTEWFAPPEFRPVHAAPNAP